MAITAEALGRPLAGSVTAPRPCAAPGTAANKHPAFWVAGIVLLVAVLVRAALLAHHEAPLVKDEQAYHDLSHSLMTRGVFAYADGRPTSFGVPVYPLFLAGVYHLFGDTLQTARVAQVIVSAFTCVLLYGIGWRLFGRAIGIVAGSLAAGSYFFAREALWLRTETLFTALVALTIYAYVRLRESSARRWALLCGLSAALATLTRSAFALWLPAMLLCEGLHRWRTRRPSPSLARAGWMLVVFALPLLIWAGRNYRVHHAWVPLATEGGEIFYLAYNPPGGRLYGFKSHNAIMQAADAMPSEVARDRFLYRAGWRSIAEDPGRVLRLVPLKLAFLWSPFDWETLGGGAYNASTVLLVPWFLAGLWLVRRHWWQAWPILLPIVYYHGIAVAFFGLPRMRLPFEPYIALLAAVGLVALARRLRHRWQMGFVFGSWAALNVGLAAASPWVKGVVRGGLAHLGMW